MAFSRKHPAVHRRRGVTLLELLVVVTLMGILSSVVVSRYGRDIFGDLGARSDAHQLWMDMQRTKTLAIRSGVEHSVVFSRASGGVLTGYQVVEGTAVDAMAGSSVTVIGEPVVFSDDIVATGTPDVVEFNFEGQASAACSVSLTGPNRSWRLSVIPLSGSVTVTEIP